MYHIFVFSDRFDIDARRALRIRLLTRQETGGSSVSASKQQPEAGFAIRGVIEGFYGPPWTHAARLRMIDFMADTGFNTYIYAPKDDPYHRERWRSPYPPPAMRKLRELINRCLERNVDFCWAVSPGLSASYAAQGTFRALAKKMLAVAGKGVSTFNLLLDDIPEDLRHAADKKKYKSLAHAQSDFANRLLARLRKSIPDCRLWFCPTTYIGTRPTPYLKTIGAELDPDIDVFWTGPVVVSPDITAADARAFGKIIQRKPLLWDNYPVNDYNRNTLNLGPLRNRDPRLGKLLAGYFSNPMNEDECSKISLLTIADYLENPAEYDADKSWRRALRAMGGDATGAAVLRRLSGLCSNRVFPDEPPNCAPAMMEKAAQGKNAALLGAMRKVEDITDQLRESVDNPFLLRELRPYALKLERTARAAALAVEAKKAAPDEQKAILRRIVPLLRGIKYDPKIIANGVIQQFIFDTVRDIAPDLKI